MENEHIKEAMDLCFGTILKTWSQHAIQRPLLLFLASMVYHHQFLLNYIAKDSSHPFQSIPILQRQGLLDELKKLVTLEKVGQVTSSTGVPYRLKQMKIIKSKLSNLESGVDKLLDQNDKLPDVVKAAIDEKCMEAGQVTVPFVINLLEEHSNKISSSIGQSVRNAVREATQHISPQQQHPSLLGDTSTVPAPRLGGRQLGQLHLYREYRGGSSVPADFKFPSATLRSAWEFWLLGFPNNRSIKRNAAGEDVVSITPVRPLRYIVADKMMPKANRLRRVWADEWKPALSIMHSGARQLIGNTPVENMNAEFIESTYAAARAFLEDKYPRLFEGSNIERNRQWKVATWSRKLREEVSRRRQMGNVVAAPAAARTRATTAANNQAGWVDITRDPRFMSTAVNGLAAAAADGTHEW